MMCVADSEVLHLCNLDLPWVTVGIIVQLDSQLSRQLQIEPLSGKEREFDMLPSQKRQVSECGGPFFGLERGMGGMVC